MSEPQSGGLRLVVDSLGSVMVPAERYYGAQTARSLQNFDIHTKLDKMPLQIIYSLAMIKEVAACINFKLGRMSSEISEAIVKACREVYHGQHDCEFPLVIWQTGSGTQTNMNVNEVVSSRASELIEGFRNSSLIVHPNDHVNLGQSSNDIFPTAMNLSIAMETAWKVVPSLNHLIDSLKHKMHEFMNVIKIGRTHMQDAVPMSVGQELSGYVSQLQQAVNSIISQLPAICYLAVGGTAVGTGLNCCKGFDKELCVSLTELTSRFYKTIYKESSPVIDLIFKPAENKFAALAGHDALLQLSGCFNTTATALMRLSNDFCLLSSGPNCGLSEFILPANEPGSSIMPGKVNPTQCESLRMVCLQIMGNHFTVSMAAAQGQLELNVCKPIIAANLLHTCELLTDSTRCFADNCVKGLQLNLEQIQEYVNKSLMLVTALTPHIGYDLSAKLVHHASKFKKGLRESAIELDLLNEEKFDEIVKPHEMAFPQ
uniref:fumarate hydratase n=1 Tax=Schistosoma japonicum TaxID=6182 RepID=C1LGX4_SCHJA|nr:fumarate hydratase 1 [Schistosoma japonicum]